MPALSLSTEWIVNVYLGGELGHSVYELGSWLSSQSWHVEHGSAKRTEQPSLSECV